MRAGRARPCDVTTRGTILDSEVSEWVFSESGEVMIIGLAEVSPWIVGVEISSARGTLDGQRRSTTALLPSRYLMSFARRAENISRRIN